MPPGAPIVVIACRAIEDLLAPLLSGIEARAVTFLEYGLHQNPKVLRETLQGALDAIPAPSLVVLGYGLCGNGLDGIAAGIHTLLIPRVDDCIPLMLGSYEAYRRALAAVPGTYYLSKGWLESGAHPLAEYEEYVETYGRARADTIMDAQYHNYRRLVLVARDAAELAAYRPLAQEVAHYCERWGMVYEEILGSDTYVRRLAEAVRDPENAGEDFVVIGPGGQVRQGSFFRERPAVYNSCS